MQTSDAKLPAYFNTLNLRSLDSLSILRWSAWIGLAQCVDHIATQFNSNGKSLRHLYSIDQYTDTGSQHLETLCTKPFATSRCTTNCGCSGLVSLSCWQWRRKVDQIGTLNTLASTPFNNLLDALNCRQDSCLHECLRPAVALSCQA